MDIDFLDHLISIISGVFILIVSGYTAYLTFFCERIKIIGYRKIDESSENSYSKIKIQIRVKDLKERWKYWWKRYWWQSNRYYKDNFKYISYTTEMGKSMYKGSIDDSACTYETHIYC